MIPRDKNSFIFQLFYNFKPWYYAPASVPVEFLLGNLIVVPTSSPDFMANFRHFVAMISNVMRGALHSLEKAYEILSEQKDLKGFLMDFSWKQKDFCQRCTRFLGVKCPSMLCIFEFSI